MKIPPKHLTALTRIRNLGDSSFEELVLALVDTPPVLYVDDLRDQVASRVSVLGQSEIDEILHALIEMYSTGIRFDLSIDDLTTHVCKALTEIEDPKTKLSDEDLDQYKGRLVKLLNIESIIFPVKGVGVLSDHERVFSHARILTDLRPIFGSSPESPPKAIAMVHTLNISYLSQGDEKNFYVSLDSEDIKTLMATLERATSKAKNLGPLLANTGLTCFTPRRN